MPMRFGVRGAAPLSVAMCVLLVGVACADASSASDPVTTATAYVQSVLNRDGARLCPLLDDGTRREVAQVVAAAKKDPTFRGPTDCAHVIRILIGYPHENMSYRFTSGKLLSVGRNRTVVVGSRSYVGVDVRVQLRTEKNGSYAPMGKPAPSPTVEDTVWLARTAHGWRTAKASLTLDVALNGSILGADPRARAYAQQAVQPPAGS
jgi:hypothetical protein